MRHLFRTLALCALVLTAGCRRAPVATPTVAPTITSTPRPTSSATPARTAAVIPPTAHVTPTPEGPAAGLIPHENSLVSIGLPEGWRVLQLDQDDASAAFTDLQQSDEYLAGIVGNPEALLSAAFWAFGPEDADFTDNLNIRRSALGAERITDMQEQVVALLLPQYAKAGFLVTGSDADFEIGGRPAAHIAYTLPVTAADGKALDVAGHQYLVATDDHLWILSYATKPGRDAVMVTLFAGSARSFRPK